MRYLFAVIALGVVVLPAYGQFATIRGRVIEAGPSAALQGATVGARYEDGTQLGDITDATGRYMLQRLKPGRYVLSVRFVGFTPFADTLDLDFDQTVVYNVSLERDEASLDEVVVDAERMSSATRAAGVETVRPAALARVPMPGVSYDLAGYLLTLPGFVSTGDRGGQLFVRGGTPTQNQVLLDGIPIFQPFHIIGFYSAFPADIISFADVYAGGFGARYGGRISSVIDITTRNGNKRNVEGSASVAPFLSSIRFDLPIARDRVSLVGSIRESLIERISPGLLGQDLPYRFGDRFLKLHAFLTQTSSLSVTALHTYDRGDAGVGPEGLPDRPAVWRNAAAGFRYNYLPPDYPVLLRFAAYYTRMDSRFEPADRVIQRSKVSSFTLEMDLAYMLGDAQVQWGLFGSLYKFAYRRGASPFEERSAITSGGAYLDGRYVLWRHLRIEPGVRLETFSHGIKSRPGPRLRLSALPFGPNSHQQWSLAWGRYYQQIIGLNNERDVADVFTIWTAAPQGAPVPRAEHIMAGVQQAIGRKVEVSVEGYLKKLDNIAFPIFSDALDNFVGFGRARGMVRGMDARIEITGRHAYLQGSYSLSEVEYTWTGDRRGFLVAKAAEGSAPGESFNPPHDRRHQIGLLSQLTVGRCKLNARWQFGSGLPFSKINGFYRAFDLDPDDAAALVDAAGEERISRSDPYGGRLPDYHRLDVTIERNFEFDGLSIKLQAGAINAYDRPNIFAFDFVSGERVNQLPIIPTLGLEVIFK